MHNEAAPILLHVGFHKTGSSWLQRKIFNNEGGGFTSEIGRPRHLIAQDFAGPDVFDFSAKDTRARYGRHIESAAKQGLTLVVSHERLSGYPASGGYDRKQIAERLASTFPEARVLIVIREQVSLIYSFYNQYITDGGCLSLDRFLRWPPPSLGRMPFFRLSFYEFHKTIALYRDAFGSERVLVLPFEMLARNPIRFARMIAQFAGQTAPEGIDPIRVNERRPAALQATQRLANCLFSYSELNPAAPLPVHRLHQRFYRLHHVFERLSPLWLENFLSSRAKRKISESVGDYYAYSNLLTSDLIRIPLKDWGYSCREAMDDASRVAS